MDPFLHGLDLILVGGLGLVIGLIMGALFTLLFCAMKGDGE